jgi:hypothetical protein
VFFNTTLSRAPTGQRPDAYRLPARPALHLVALILPSLCACTWPQQSTRPLLGIRGSGRIPDRRDFPTRSAVVPSHPLYQYLVARTRAAMERSFRPGAVLDYPQVSLDDLSEPPPPYHTDSQPSTTRASRATVSAAALSRAEVASEKKKQPKMNAWQDAARDRAQSRRTGAALGTRGPSLPTNRPRRKVEASPLALLELPGLKLKLGAPAPAAHRLGLEHPHAPRPHAWSGS